jgi:predicted transport protein
LGLKLFRTTKDGAAEVEPWLAEVEGDVQRLIEANMETLLGVTFLASEYVIDCVDGGRIDSLGIDGAGAPVIVEYKRGTDPGVISQGLFYMAWLTAHRDVFKHLVRDRLGAAAAAQVRWSAPRLICVAGDFTRYDIHAVREHRRRIELVRYRFFGTDLIGLEPVASATGAPHRGGEARRGRRAADARRIGHVQGRMAELVDAVDETLLGLGRDITRVENRTYRAYQRVRNFACVCPPQRSKLLVYLPLDPRTVDLVPGFTRDVSRIGHHGTGDLEVRLRTERDLETAAELFRLSYTVA